MADQQKIRVEVPKPLEFLYAPAPFKVAWGGRGGVKSYGFADALTLSAVNQYERILCARETMDSIAESVHHLLEKRARSIGFGEHFEFLKSTIIGPMWVNCKACWAQFNPDPATKAQKCPKCGKGDVVDTGRSEFIFAGLRHNVHNIKSLEGCTKCWVEEAQSVSKNSWETLLPTIRWEDRRAKRSAEIWVSFNPDLSTDDTYKRWVLEPPPGAKVVKTSYRDNPWFPEGLRSQMEHMKKTDPAGYMHVWEGECLGALEGAIFREEMKQVTMEGRICAVPYHRKRPVDTAWDLGFDDLTAIWFVQAYDGFYHFIDYLEGYGQTIHDYLVKLQGKNYLYGTDWLPHDAVDTIIHKKLSGSTGMAIEQIMRNAGRKVRIVPKLLKIASINGARTIFPQCKFDEKNCADGIQSLRHYRWSSPPEMRNSDGSFQVLKSKAKTVPMHDLASHGADAFIGAALGIKQPKAEIKQAPRQLPRASEHSWMA